MKILLSAIACDPYRGSEAHFGWNAARILSTRHEVWILGHAKDEMAIEQAREERLIGENVRFFPHSSWSQRHPNRIVSRLQNWRDYEVWSRNILPTAQRLQKEVGFDIVHHVTLSTWRVPSQLWRVGVPFIWGPIGGAEVFPLRLLPFLSPASAIYEMLRRMQNTIAMLSSGVRDCVRNSAHIFGSNLETVNVVRRLGCSDERSSLLSAAFFSEDQIARFSGESVQGSKSGKPSVFANTGKTRSRRGSSQLRPHSIDTQETSTLRLFAGGDIEGRKGHALALHALAKCKQQGLRFRYHIAGIGPESPHLQALAKRLGIADQVFISPPLRGDEYMAALSEADVYLLPSLRDNAPVTLMEAMLSGCVPVVVACGGPGLIVTGDCGVRISAGSGKHMVDQLVTALLRISADRPLLDRLSHGARKRIAETFHERNYLQALDRAYLDALIKFSDRVPSGARRQDGPQR